MGQKIEGKYVEFCFLLEMLVFSRIKVVICKIMNVMVYVQKYGIDIIVLGGFLLIVFENFNLQKFK